MSTRKSTARPSDLHNDMSLKLARIHATLDVLYTVALSKEPGADIESLCANTLDMSLWGLMRDIESVREYFDKLPVPRSEEGAASMLAAGRPPVTTAKDSPS